MGNGEILRVYFLRYAIKREIRLTHEKKKQKNPRTFFAIFANFRPNFFSCFVAVVVLTTSNEESGGAGAIRENRFKTKYSEIHRKETLNISPSPIYLLLLH